MEFYFSSINGTSWIEFKIEGEAWETRFCFSDRSLGDSERFNINDVGLSLSSSSIFSWICLKFRNLFIAQMVPTTLVNSLLLGLLDAGLYILSKTPTKTLYVSVRGPCDQYLLRYSSSTMGGAPWMRTYTTPSREANCCWWRVCGLRQNFRVCGWVCPLDQGASAVGAVVVHIGHLDVC